MDHITKFLVTKIAKGLADVCILLVSWYAAWRQYNIMMLCHNYDLEIFQGDNSNS